MKKRIFILDAINPRAQEMLETVGQVVPASSHDPKTLIKEAAGASAIIVRSNQVQVTRELMEAAGRDLKVAAHLGVGLDSFDLEAAREMGVRILNSPHGNTRAVAEHFILLALGVSRRILKLDRWLRQGDWSGLKNYSATEMTGRTLGVLGFGHIGQLVAQMCSAAFRMPVIYSSRSAHGDAAALLGAERVERKEELFARADYLAVCLALTADTRGLVNRDLISLMKPTAFLINVSRGAVWNEEHLAEALKANTIAGAAADVYAAEPAPADHPLFSLDNFFGTPHCAALTAEADQRIDLEVAQSVLDILEGRQPAEAAV